MTTVNVERTASATVQVTRGATTVEVDRKDHSIVVQRTEAPMITVTRSYPTISLGGNAPVVSVTRGDPIVSITRDGAMGPPGSGIAVTYTHVQNTADTEWLINHQLGRYPSVTVVDSAGTHVIGGVTYVDEFTIRVSFDFQFSGKAYLN